MADLLLTNCSIYTLDPTRPRANAIAFASGRVVAFDDDARSIRTSRTQVLDLTGRTVIPGLTDSHIHFTGYALGLARVQLEGARSLDEAMDRVAERAQTVPPGEWILGMGWNHLEWVDPRFPDKTPLDRVAPAHPVALDRKDGHSTWVNSMALRLAHITRETPDPAGGVIERDSLGEPSGLLREKAAWLLEKWVGAAMSHVSAQELQRAIANAHALGLVGIHNVEGPDALRAFERLNSQGKLNLRIVQMIPADNLEYAVALGLESGLGDEYLSIGGIKIFADGSLGSQTAHMLEPFEGQPGNYGVAVTPPEQIEYTARTAAEANIMVLTHAIGDCAIRDVLDVYGRLRREGYATPFRIEHVQHLHPADLPRFNELDVIASMQPIHATSDFRIADQLVGKRARYSYAFKSLLNSGAKLVFGSDCPVETLDPLAGIHAAVTRERENGEPAGGWYPEERLSVDEALGGYATPLRVGGHGDCVVLSQDIYRVPARAILETRVDYTIVGGSIVHSA